jgi:hypothetical protein
MASQPIHKDGTKEGVLVELHQRCCETGCAEESELVVESVHREEVEVKDTPKISL